MESTRKYTTGQIFLAVLGGTVLGAVTTFLIAPKSGRETRKQIVGYFDDAKDAFSKVPEALRSASHAAKEAFTEANG